MEFQKQKTETEASLMSFKMIQNQIKKVSTRFLEVLEYEKKHITLKEVIDEKLLKDNADLGSKEKQQRSKLTEIKQRHKVLRDSMEKIRSDLKEISDIT